MIITSNQHIIYSSSTNPPQRSLFQRRQRSSHLHRRHHLQRPGFRQSHRPTHLNESLLCAGESRRSHPPYLSRLKVSWAPGFATAPPDSWRRQTPGSRSRSRSSKLFDSNANPIPILLSRHPTSWSHPRHGRNRCRARRIGARGRAGEARPGERDEYANSRSRNASA